MILLAQLTTNFHAFNDFEESANLVPDCHLQSIISHIPSRYGQQSQRFNAACREEISLTIILRDLCGEYVAQQRANAVYYKCPDHSNAMHSRSLARLSYYASFLTCLLALSSVSVLR